MGSGAVEKLLKKSGCRLTELQENGVREYHGFHGDRHIEIVGALPNNGVLVRLADYYGEPFTVIDEITVTGYCREYTYIRKPDERAEMKMIQAWLRRFGLEDKRSNGGTRNA